MSQTNGPSNHKFYGPAIRAVAHTAAQLREADEGLLERVRRRPLSSLAIALAAGYLVGRVFSRI